MSSISWPSKINIIYADLKTSYLFLVGGIRVANPSKRKVTSQLNKNVKKL